MENKDPRFIYVYMSALLCNEALTEIFYISEAKNKDELDLLDGNPFSFYKVSLQYCFNSEYNKLLELDKEKDKKKPNKHIASLNKLNNFLYSTNKKEFQSIYDMNETLLQSIVNTKFQKNQRELRNQKFSHADYTEINNPLKIKDLTDKEIQEGFKHLSIIYQVINNCAGYFDFTYASHVPHHDDKTRIFIKYHAVYKKYFHANFIKAHSEGYILH